MKTKLSIASVAAGLLVAGGLTAEASLPFTEVGSSSDYTATFSGSQVIPDNDYSGVAYLMNFGAVGLNISDVSVTLNISGGYNGDLYAYLSDGSTLVQLLNPNPAVSTSGFDNVTLSETGASIPTGGSGPLTGNYIAYGNLSSFNGADPNGNWTLFLADLSAGDTSTLTGFTVDITAVPEPTSVGLILFGCGFVVAEFARRCRKKTPCVAGRNF